MSSSFSFGPPVGLKSEINNKSSSEVAWKLIEQVSHLHSKFPPHLQGQLKLLSVDGLMHLAERFTECQESFRRAGKPIVVEVGFHYTHPKHLESIRTRGLVVGRKARHGSRFGSGVYIANNPHAFMTYGGMGVIVLYIQGTTKQLTVGFPSQVGLDIDTLRGNKLTRTSQHNFAGHPISPYFDEIVPRTTEQVLPIMYYRREMLNNAELFFELHRELQSLVDTCLNGFVKIAVKRHIPHHDDLSLEQTLRDKKFEFWNVRAPQEDNDVYCPGPWVNGRKSNEKPYSKQHFSADAECPICLCSLQTDRSVSLYKCQHGFHKECIDQALNKASKCPICRVMVGAPFGNCPKGTMTIRRDKAACSGSSKYGTIIIEYDIPRGIQDKCHENPGRSYQRTNRVAYLPDNKGGRRLLSRLKYAFEKGLTFAVGTSLTTGRKNVVTWTSVHHKTSRTPGPHGYPDLGYFLNCNEALDNLGVPQASDL